MRKYMLKAYIEVGDCMYDALDFEFLHCTYVCVHMFVRT